MRDITLIGVLRGRVAVMSEKSLQLVQDDFEGGVSSELALLSEWRNSRLLVKSVLAQVSD